MAAIAVANALEIDEEKIRAAIASFRGVKRRFEYIIKRPDLVFVDDYAHHPQELKALINGVKTLFVQKKCTLIFQPHLYSRTNDFADAFSKVLNDVDELILLPIYPARELPMEGVTSEMIIDKMNAIDDRSIPKRVLSKEALLSWVENDFAEKRNKEFGEVLVTAGAGDIDKLVQPIKQILEK
ncbi:MAG: cyanophycin synthetase [Propionicimonas sp.]